MDNISNIIVLSSQTDLPYMTITSLEKIPSLDLNYIVIASNTVLHHEQLVFLEKNLQGKKILVEKPLFDSYQICKIIDNQVYVGYNLRFHPVLKKIKKVIKNMNIWNIQLFCGSYLPDWRPARDYRKTSSAKRETGGGVLLDLSHELDYIQWLVGTIDINYVFNEKISDLEIETDDILLLYGKSKTGTQIQISLNYFTLKPLRQIIIDGKGISIQADLITNRISIILNNQLKEYSWPHLKRDDSYLEQHSAVLSNTSSQVCTYKEGLKTMCLIDSIRSFNA